MQACNPSLWGVDRWVSVARWPASLAESVSISFSKGSRLRNGGRECLRKMWMSTFSSTCMYTCTCAPSCTSTYSHLTTYTHIHRRRSLLTLRPSHLSIEQWSIVNKSISLVSLQFFICLEGVAYSSPHYISFSCTIQCCFTILKQRLLEDT